MGKRFASFCPCLAFARFLKVKFWRSFIKCQYFNDGSTDFHKKYIPLYIFLLLFSKTGKTRVWHRVKMMTRWPGRERWPKWPIHPVTQWPSSMSGVHGWWWSWCRVVLAESAHVVPAVADRPASHTARLQARRPRPARLPRRRLPARPVSWPPALAALSRRLANSWMNEWMNILFINTDTHTPV